jgi:superfamily II DNA or RNA helicase
MNYGRDRRRGLSQDELVTLFTRADGKCQRCDVELDSTWQQAHLMPWSGGGATTLENMEAWCAPCNWSVGAEDVSDRATVQLREWQAAALPTILDKIFQQGVATLNAAPGAGKTIFAGTVFQRLAAAGFAERLVVVVPNKALVEQWVRTMSALGIHLDSEPRNGFIELPGTVGAVVTYQSLPGSASGHVTRQQAHPTLVVLDEVHHVADTKAWGNAAKVMVGQLGGIKCAGVLNLTGTLFRSNGTDRISTVRYEHVEVGDDAAWHAQADYSISTADLVGKQLRPPDSYVYTGRAEVLDLRTQEVTSGALADLSPTLRKAAIRDSFESRAWVDGFAKEAVRMLMNQQDAIGPEEPLKMLYIAANVKAARRAADAINQLVGDDFAHLVVNDEPGVLRTLRQARQERRSCAIVAVKMVTEGFDCPEVSTIAYASNIVAPLSVAQMMARAMRITKTERARRMILPAQFLIPDHQELREAFAAAMLPTQHVVQELKQLEDADERGSGGGGNGSELRFRLLDLSNPVFQNATVVGETDGDIPAVELAEWEREFEALGVPATYGPRVALAARRVRRFPRLYSTPEVDDVTVTQADPRTINKQLRAQLQKISNWMHHHVVHDLRWNNIAEFQYRANEAGGYDKREDATHDQLAASIAWMTTRVYEHCERSEEGTPSWLAPE